jgi:hypothetical protein
MLIESAVKLDGRKIFNNVLGNFTFALLRNFGKVLPGVIVGQAANEIFNICDGI